jgi:hypothetical protein
MIEDEKSYAITERTFSKRPAAGCSIPIVSALTSYVLIWWVLECRIANRTVYVDSTEVSRIECSRNGDRKVVVYLTCYFAPRSLTFARGCACALFHEALEMR